MWLYYTGDTAFLHPEHNKHILYDTKQLLINSSIELVKSTAGGASSVYSQAELAAYIAY